MNSFLDLLEKVLTWFFSIAFGLLLIYGGMRYKHYLDNESDPWLQAKKKGTAEAYLTFLRDCRGCPEEGPARKALDALQSSSGMLARLASEHLPERASIMLPVFSPDGTKVLATGGSGPDFWDADTGKRSSYGNKTFTHKDGQKKIDALDFAPDGRRIAAGMAGREGGRLMIWDLTGEALIAEREIEGADMRGVLFSPDGSWLGWRGDGPVGLWNPVLGQFLRAAHDGVTSMAFAQDANGQITFITASGRDLSFWDPATMEEVKKQHIDSDRPLLGLSRDGRVVAFSDGPVLELWDPVLARQLASLRDLKGHVTAYCRETETGRIAVGTDHGLLYLWDPQASVVPVGYVAAHQGPVDVLACGAGGRVVSTGWDGAKVWSLTKLKGQPGVK